MGDGPEDPIVGTVAHVPYPQTPKLTPSLTNRNPGMGTARGVDCNKGSVVWVEYPGNTTLYEVARGLLFPSPEEAETCWREAVGRNKKAKTTTNPSNPQTNPQSNQPQPTTTEPLNPMDKENKENKEQEWGDPAKVSNEP